MPPQIRDQLLKRQKEEGGIHAQEIGYKGWVSFEIEFIIEGNQYVRDWDYLAENWNDEEERWESYNCDPECDKRNLSSHCSRL